MLLFPVRTTVVVDFDVDTAVFDVFVVLLAVPHPANRPAASAAHPADTTSFRSIPSPPVAIFIFAFYHRRGKTKVQQERNRAPARRRV